MEFLLRIHCLHFKSDYRVDFYGGKKLVNPGKNLSNNWKQGLRTDSTPVWKKGLGGGGENGGEGEGGMLLLLHKHAKATIFSTQQQHICN